MTETDEVAQALDRAAQRWPGEPRSKLLLRLIRTGSEILDRRRQDEIEAHKAAVMLSSGAYPDAYGPAYLAELRADWPA